MDFTEVPEVITLHFFEEDCSLLALLLCDQAVRALQEVKNLIAVVLEFVLDLFFVPLAELVAILVVTFGLFEVFGFLDVAERSPGSAARSNSIFVTD